MPRIQVFVSSKMGELATERDALYRVLPSFSYGIYKVEPWLFEKDAPASDKTIREVYLNALRNSALYVGLFWNEYGEWTIDEFERAGEWNIPRHIYVKNLDTDNRDSKLHDFLSNSQQVTSGTTHKWFSTIDELTKAVESSISEWLKASFWGRPGSNKALNLNDPDEVPHLLRRLIGRESVIEDIETQLDKNYQVLLQGLGGTGKTVLAAEIASRWIENGRGEVLWLLGGTLDLDGFLDALSHPLYAQRELASAHGEEKHQLLKKLLRQSRVSLLILDDVWNGAALHTLLQILPRKMHILVTSRQRYGLESIINLPNLSESSALDLLRQYGQNYAADEATALALIKKLAYLPFAVEIAGKSMQMNQWSAETLLLKIANSPHQMKVPLDFRGEDRESVAALLEASFYALPESTRIVLMAFGAFFDLRLTSEMLAFYFSGKSIRFELEPTSKLFWDIEEGTSFADHFAKLDRIIRTNLKNQIDQMPPNQTDEQIETALNTLFLHGLVERIKQTDDTVLHYRIHDLTYTYLANQATTFRRSLAADRCLGYAHKYREPNPKNFAALRPELENLIAAGDWFSANGAYENVQFFAQDLVNEGGFLIREGYYKQAKSVLEQCIVASQATGKLDLEVSYLDGLANIYSILGEFDLASDCIFRALDIAKNNNFSEHVSQLYLSLSGIYIETGAYDKAKDIASQARLYAQQHQDQKLEFVTLLNLARVEDELANAPEAILMAEKALAIAQEMQNQELVAVAKASLGTYYARTAQKITALEHLRQAIEYMRLRSAKSNLAAALCNLGVTYRTFGDYPDALEAYQESLSILRETNELPKIGRVLSNIGTIYREMGNGDTAKSYYEQSQSIFEKLGLSHLLSRTDRLARGYNHTIHEHSSKLLSSKLSQESLGAEPEMQDNSLQIILDEAKSLAESGNIREAIKFLSTALDNNQNSVLYVRRGELYSQLHEYEASISDFTKAILLRPNDFGLHTNRGNRFLQAGRVSEALLDYDRAIELDPSIPDAYRNRGQAKVLLGTLQDALSDYDKALALDSQYKRAAHERAQLFVKMKLFDNAITAFTQLLTLDEQFVDVYVNRGAVYVQQRRFQEAFNDFTLAIAIDPNNVLPYLQRAQLYEVLGAVDKALADYNIAEATGNPTATIFSNRARIYSSMGKDQEAMRDYLIALKLNPSDALTYINCGNLYYRLGKKAEALQSYQAAININPQFGEAYLYAADLISQLPEFKRALQDMNEPDSIEIINTATLYAEMAVKLNVAESGPFLTKLQTLISRHTRKTDNGGKSGFLQQLMKRISSSSK